MNAFANAGTTSDQFLRENLEWLGRASNWSMFSATAALGVIHKGSLARAMTVLGPYLPRDDGTSAPHSSPYSEGGSLYALGLINAGHGKDALGYLLDKLKNTTDEIVQHGAALGLGMTGLASQREGKHSSVSHQTNHDGLTLKRPLFQMCMKS
jgi:26S proteasome regulatory subunit N2